MTQLAFIMDQQVGLRTQALNYERAVGGVGGRCAAARAWREWLRHD